MYIKLNNNIMKQLFILLAIITTISCKAQNIVPIYEGPEDSPPLPRYYKDVDNDFNPYIGEWKWEENNTFLTIVFDKRTMVPNSNGNAFQDYLIGAYSYTVNDLELVNSFPLQLSPENIVENHIYGWVITTLIKAYMPPCPECPDNVRYIKLSISDPNRPGLLARLCMVHFIDNGIEKIRMRIWKSDVDLFSLPENYTGPDDITIPEGIYTFIKQD